MNLKVLIVEDDPASDKLISALIRNIAREILHVKNGTDALEICRKTPDLDLVMMDIGIPGLNGYESTRLIRQFNTKLVIIAQTAFALDGDREKAIESGCNDYIAKPIVKGTLMSILEKQFH
ncbi:MAG: response regulator [Bacteroidales bacterium]|jgi:CheY-like chemotaxis protein